MGVSSIQVKGPKDCFSPSDVIPLLYKIDNSLSNSKVKYVSVKLIRILKFRSHGEMAQSIGEPNHRFLVFSGRYEGIENNA